MKEHRIEGIRGFRTEQMGHEALTLRDVLLSHQSSGDVDHCLLPASWEGTSETIAVNIT